MINSALYREPVLLDPAVHRHLKMGVLEDFGITRGMHAVYCTATEFPQAALEFAILFVNAGDKDPTSGRPNVSPIVLLGLSQGENLLVNEGKWDARYMPAFIRRFPFLTANIKGANSAGVLIDSAWQGFSATEGEPLFGPDDKPAPALQRAMQFLELFEVEAQRTRAFCARVTQLDVLKEMKADATLPGGTTLSVDGFYVVDEEKLRALPESAVVELHRNGMLMLLNLHLLSLGNIRQLVDRKALRMADAQGAAAAPPAA